MIHILPSAKTAILAASRPFPQLYIEPEILTSLHPGVLAHLPSYASCRCTKVALAISRRIASVSTCKMDDMAEADLLPPMRDVTLQFLSACQGELAPFPIVFYLG